jgi:hypothetical protein
MKAGATSDHYGVSGVAPLLPGGSESGQLVRDGPNRSTHDDPVERLVPGDAPSTGNRGDGEATDHSLVQDLLNAGTIIEAEAKADPRQHVITRAIGAGERKLGIDKEIGQVRPGDRFLLCGDGLYKAPGLETIAGLLTAPQDDAAKRLVAAATVGNARDNVTSVVAAL